MTRVTLKDGVIYHEPPLDKAVRLINELLDLDHETVTLLNWHHSEEVNQLLQKLGK